MGKPEPRKPVAVLGMGKMGRALAGRLLECGWPTFLWNRTASGVAELEARGAIRLESLDQLWDRADVAISFLANDAALAEVCLGESGILVAGAEGRLLIDMSTVSPSVSHRISDASANAGIAYLRSPVSGNPAVLASGAITLFVSGPKETFDAAEDLLRSIGPTVLYVGDAEQARVLKLAINSALAVTIQILAELIVLGEANGLNRETLLSAMGKSVIGSPFVAYKTPGLVHRDYSPTFTTALLAKDLDLVVALIRESAVELPSVELVRQLAHDAVARGYGDVDFSALLPSLQRTLGIDPDLQPPAAPVTPRGDDGAEPSHQRG
jgi:3-hydroxyisobutyrate dehydrogenase